ncbi:hypothetical protein AgCh_025948 [Apium graveolens]
MLESERRYPINKQDYILFVEVGDGVSATVYKALCVPFDEKVAIKVLDLEKCNNDLWKLEKNEVKLKSSKNASELVGQYHEKHKPCANIAIGLDYDVLNIKKKNIGDKEKATENENIPAMLKKKNAEVTQSCKAEEKLMENQGSKTPIKEIKTEDARKKKKNRNEKIGTNKSNNFAYVVDAPRKKCEKCGSVNHLM